MTDPTSAESARSRIERGGPIGDAWPALAPVFAASPYLAGLAAADPERLERLLAAPPERSLEAFIHEARRAGDLEPADGASALRSAKQGLHLLTALCDLGGVWALEEVTVALTQLADAATASALRLAASAMGLGRADGAAGPAPGLFVVALGKMGAFELNYSSDIDVSVFYQPELLPSVGALEPQVLATRLTQRLASLLQERTHEGYVFRVDLRLRPDPSSTSPAVPVAQAIAYYQSVGQNWERAALIKARICAGDRARGEAFLDELTPFVWRRSLDFAAVSDIHSIKRQIQDLQPDARLSARGADLKLGPGGIREIEFFVQTQQLILGGRHPHLRAKATLEALAALRDAGHVAVDAADDLAPAYRQLRTLEHRVQMIADEQTHRLPLDDRERRRIASLAGHSTLQAFDRQVVRTLRTVARRYGELFAGEEPLSSRHGSLIFTGVENDPQTLATLERMGFSQPAGVAQAMRGWLGGQVSATRTERGRELLTRLAPRLLDALAATAAPDEAFERFALFFAGLPAGAQVPALFLARPKLMELILRVMAIAPALARSLARRPAALDALLDASFFAPLQPLAEAPELAGANGFEAAMDAARRLHRERVFQIGVQLIAGASTPEAAGRSFSELADLCIGGLSRASLAEIERQAGVFPGHVAVIGLGRCGAAELSATSDLDLMTVYASDLPTAESAQRGWAAETYFGRFTQRLITALSVPTSEGGLYEVDMRLRPSGSKGPVAVSLAALERYYQGEAETWERQALTCARVVWATDPLYAARVGACLEAQLRMPQDKRRLAADIRAMRLLVRRERPAAGFWDFKLEDGGLLEIEFAAQFLQLAHAAEGGPLRQNTGEALQALATAGMAPAGALAELSSAWRLQQNLRQLVSVALTEAGDPDQEPRALAELMAKAAGVRGRKGLRAAIASHRRAARRAVRELLSGQ